ncbi:hypothetical protein H8K47_01630 [Undibacterium sp. CY7W]|uniref:Uncharacterized protein n=1 Tax=Undibacterium rugosum TaxID=2762291 RepID=A0A923HXL3_9BURK|nr:hypothetical protein [Undibacterium rugosum]MBC3934049.1 hypothetical protein [Undibacterium rugosum]
MVTPEAMELSRLRACHAAAKAGERNYKKGGGVLYQGYSVKHAWIDVNRKTYALTEMCSVLNVNPSGYRTCKHGGTPARKRLMDTQMLAIIRAIPAERKGAYSCPHGARIVSTRFYGRQRGAIPCIERAAAEIGGWVLYSLAVVPL